MKSNFLPLPAMTSRTNPNPLLTGIVEGFRDETLAGRLISMGIIPGQTLELIRKTLFGRTYYVQCGKRIIGLRQKEFQTLILGK